MLVKKLPLRLPDYTWLLRLLFKLLCVFDRRYLADFISAHWSERGQITEQIAGPYFVMMVVELVYFQIWSNGGNRVSLLVFILCWVMRAEQSKMWVFLLSSQTMVTDIFSTFKQCNRMEQPRKYPLVRVHVSILSWNTAECWKDYWLQWVLVLQLCRSDLG